MMLDGDGRGEGEIETDRQTQTVRICVMYACADTIARAHAETTKETEGTATRGEKGEFSERREAQAEGVTGRLILATSATGGGQ